MGGSISSTGNLAGDVRAEVVLKVLEYWRAGGELACVLLVSWIVYCWCPGLCTAGVLDCVLVVVWTEYWWCRGLVVFWTM